MCQPCAPVTTLILSLMSSLMTRFDAFCNRVRRMPFDQDRIRSTYLDYQVGFFRDTSIVPNQEKSLQLEEAGVLQLFLQDVYSVSSHFKNTCDTGNRGTSHERAELVTNYLYIAHWHHFYIFLEEVARLVIVFVGISYLDASEISA